MAGLSLRCCCEVDGDGDGLLRVVFGAVHVLLCSAVAGGCREGVDSDGRLGSRPSLSVVAKKLGMRMCIAHILPVWRQTRHWQLTNLFVVGKGKERERGR